MRQQAWTALPVPSSTGRVDSVAGDLVGNQETQGRFGGFILRNSSAVAVQVDFYDNTTAGTGNLLGSADLTAKGTVGSYANIVFDSAGNRYDKGVYAVISGAGVIGSVLIA